MAEPIDPATPLSVRLSAADWNNLLAVISEAPVPYKVTAPLIQTIGQQIQAAAAAQDDQQ